MRRPLSTALSIACVSALVLACSQQPQQATDARAADEAAIRQADIAWAETGETRNLDAQLEFYTEEPVPIIMPPNMPLARGKGAIREILSQLYDRPDFSVTWRPGQVEVARSGDIGFVLGTYETTMNDPEGNPRTDKGKYIEIWKKQADGSWKVAADMFNSDLPPVPVPMPSAKD